METLNKLILGIGVEDIIALFFSGVVGFLWLSGQEVPDGLLNVTLIIMGFLFGDKSATRAQARTIEAINPPPAAPYIADPED
jgi:hypothetical protein